MQSSISHALNGTAAELVWLLPLLPLLGFVVNGVIALRPSLHGRRATPWIGSGVMLAAFALAITMLVAMLSAPPLADPFVRHYGAWMPVGDLVINWGLQLDQLSMVMTLVITGVGFLIHVFSAGYMASDAGLARYFAYLNLFVAAMLLLVLGSSYPVMFVGWEGVGLASYLLIGFWFDVTANANAGRKAFIVNRIGDFGLLVAIFIIFSTTGTLDFVSAHAALSLADPAVLTSVALFLFLGCAGKSAQLPLYIWLPDAMAGPTPVSALIHAATMVTAGVYLVARAAPVFAGAPEVSLFVAIIGALTALFAATIALRQWDIKKVLAYSTISQLGYMFVAVGVGAYSAGVFHLITHAFFKALLFLGAGAVIHAMHAAYHAAHDHDSDPQDLRNMGGLRKYLPLTSAVMLLATLAIIGVPPFSGFFSKDEILTAVFARATDSPLAGVSLLGVSGGTWLYLVYGLGLVTALLTAVYMARLGFLAFAGENRTGEVASRSLHEGPRSMQLPMVLLAILTVGGGWLNLPEVIPVGPGHLLTDWLAPVTGEASRQLGGEAHLSHATEYALIGVAVFVALLGIAVAWWLHRRSQPQPTLAATEHGWRGLLGAAYRVDAGLDATVVRPLTALSTNVLWRGIDLRLDRSWVSGGQAVARWAGRANDAVGAGDVGRFAWVIAIGVLAVLAAFTVR